MADQPALSWGPNDKHRLLNTQLPRVDGMAKATGTAQYTYDAKPPQMLFGRLLLSRIACGTVSKLDDTAARAIPGVKAVIKGDARVMFEGQVIAAVAATTPQIAAEAIRALEVQYDHSAFIVTADDALKPDAPKVFRDGNVRAGETRGDKDKTTDALTKCDATIDVEYRTARLHHACLETHGMVVDYSGGDSATVYASTQQTHSIAPDSAKALGLDQSNVTAIVQHMGGGFGAKFGIGVPGMWACRLSKETKLPVKVMLTRFDEFIAGGNGPGSVQKVKAGVTKDGTLTAMIAEQYGLGGVGQGRVVGLPFIYDCKNMYRQNGSIHTNEDSSVALRAPGNPQTSFVMESVMDELANKIGMDPIEFRKKNQQNESWRRQLDTGAKVIGWERRNAKPGGGDSPIKRGIGCGLGQWGGGGRAQCVVTLQINKDGAVTASVGSQDLGTGTRTYIRAIVAEELGLGMDDVKEEIGSSKLGNANGSGGSTTAASLAPAVKDAAVKARIAFAERVASVIGAGSPDAVKFEEGSVSAGDKKISWQQACAALPAAGLSVTGTWQRGLSGNGVHGAAFAEVEVDTRTGAVHAIKMVHVQDAGLPLNRLAVESQINGGMIQALGMALYEGRVVDRDLGVMLNPEFGSYKLPGCLEMPELVPIIDDGDTRQEVIGIAESTNVAGVGAIANAVFNACGVRVRELPITPDKILMGLQAMKGQTA